MAGGAGAQHIQGCIAAQIRGDDVAVDGVGRGGRVGIAHPPLDLARCPAAFPQADQPQAVDALGGHGGEHLDRDLVERGDGSCEIAGELLEPHVGVLGQQHEARHPRRIGREALRVVGRAELRCLHLPIPARQVVPIAQGAGMRLLGQEVKGQREAPAGGGREVGRPVPSDPAQLTGQRVGRGRHGTAQQVHQAHGARCRRGGRGSPAARGWQRVVQRREDAQVLGRPGQLRVIEQGMDTLERGIRGMQAEQHQLLQGAAGRGAGHVGRLVGRWIRQRRPGQEGRSEGAQRAGHVRAVRRT